ncbi:MAG: hypothetical protein V4667_05925 [Bacteroidota bacterium]
MTRDIFGSFSHEVDYLHTHRYIINGGIETIFELDKKWCLETGLLIMDWGYKEKESSTFFANYTTKYITERNIYLTLPISILYKYKMFYFCFGPNASYFIERQKTVNGHETTDKLPLFAGYSKHKHLDFWLFGLQTKLGFSTKINSRLTFKSELHANIAEPYLLRGNGFYSVGLGFGLTYKIK